VVEYLNGKQTIYDNPVGVVTNAPDFGWHLTNLNNYAFLSNRDRNNGSFGKLQVEAPDSGNALAGVPSSQISAGRFVKAAYYVQYARRADSPDEAVITLSHILNNFDRVYDISVDQGFAGEGGNKKSTSSEVTLFTWMNDKMRNRYYLRTIGAMNFVIFEIDKLKSIQKVVKVPLAKINDASPDGTQVLLGVAK
jgi:penicillin V acylase-like amidase (Ntn superfamily)